MNNSGYGTTVMGSRTDGSRRSVGRHVKAFIEAYGPVPDGLEVHHLCYNRRCLEPTHLRATTRSENLRDKSPEYVHPMSRVTECPSGHPYSPENTRWYKKRRHCRECGRIASRAWHNSKNRV